jgi:CheY-like chemotaxis protein
MAKLILVVDDDESILEVVQIVLESEGYTVQTAMNSDFVQQLPTQVPLPDLILLDVLLSGEDGREISRQLKGNAQLQHIPVIMLSAHSDASKNAHTGSADAFLEKPFDVDVLLDTVQQHLATH